MTKKSIKAAASRQKTAKEAAKTEDVDELGGTGGARKAYRRPSVEKRRSLSQATLVSGGGMPGTLSSGGP